MSWERWYAILESNYTSRMTRSYLGGTWISGQQKLLEQAMRRAHILPASWFHGELYALGDDFERASERTGRPRSLLHPASSVHGSCPKVHRMRTTFYLLKLVQGK